MASPSSNFVFPFKSLSTPRLRLELLDPPKHAPLLFAGCKDHPRLFDYLTYGPFTSIPQLIEWCRTRIQEKPTSVAWAIYAKTEDAQTEEQQWEFAGITGLVNADVQNRSVELGLMTILPSFQRTFVGNTTRALLLLFALDPPPHGLGLRRAYRLNHTANEAANWSARRMGFEFEGIIRFDKVVPAGKIGNGVAVAGQEDSRDSCVYAICCDQWDEKRRAVVLAMERKDREAGPADVKL